MKSSSPASAHCRSSKTSTTGTVVGEPLEEEPPGGEEVLPIVVSRGRRGRAAAASRGSSQAALFGVGHALVEHRAASFAVAARRTYPPPTISARIRTISASAQYATPSP